MRLAIVGSQEKWWPVGLYDEVLEIIIENLDRVQPDIVVSGGADGVDRWAEMLAEERLIETDIRHPKGKTWEHYEARNIEIVERSDMLLCIRSKTAGTYGSGWTADYAEKFGRIVKRVVL